MPSIAPAKSTGAVSTRLQSTPDRHTACVFDTPQSTEVASTERWKTISEGAEVSRSNRHRCELASAVKRFGWSNLFRFRSCGTRGGERDLSRCGASFPSTVGCPGAAVTWWSFCRETEVLPQGVPFSIRFVGAEGLHGGRYSGYQRMPGPFRWVSTNCLAVDSIIPVRICQRAAR